MHSHIPERRINTRLRTQFPILIPRGTGVEAEGITRDVSPAGVFFYTDLPVEIGQAIEFKMLMPHGGATSRALCNGTVVRIESGPRPAIQTVHGVAVHVTTMRLA